MTKLIADSGSTKTDWCVCHLGEIKQCISTQGINPFHQSVKEIANIIHEMASQLTCLMDIERIEFFGAGCALPEKKAILTNILQEVFNHHPSSIYVASDLEGAARAVCQGSAGIACILGTGSNSCQFDGEKIVANTPCLGYILGDEGSGAVLGRRLVSDCLKGQLPTHLSEAFSHQVKIVSLYRFKSPVWVLCHKSVAMIALLSKFFTRQGRQRLYGIHIVAPRL